MSAEARRQFAVRFMPSDDRARVPMDTYLGALGAMRDGLVSTRTAFAQKMADKRRWSIQEVREALTLEVQPVEKGSLVTPIGVSAALGSQVTLAHAEALESDFWKYTIDAINCVYAIVGTSLKKSTNKLTSAGARAFLRAAELAKEGSCEIHLAQRELAGRAKKWATAANVSQMSQGLKQYVEILQRPVNRSSSSLVGQITDISNYDHPSFRIRTSKGRVVTVRAYAHQRDVVQAAWGKEVVVDLTADVDLEGNISDAVAIDIHLVPTDPFADFEESYGSGSDLWSTPEGQRFIRTMRGGVAS
jgi:hypothetical protein